MRTVVLPALRGELRDRRGRVLATTRPVVRPGGSPGAAGPRQLRPAGHHPGARSGPTCRSGPGWPRRAKGVRPEPMTFAEDITDEHMAAVATRDGPGGCGHPSRTPAALLLRQPVHPHARLHQRDHRRGAEAPAGRGVPAPGPGRAHRPRAPVERYLRGQAGFEKAGGGPAQPAAARRERGRSGQRSDPARAGARQQRDPHRRSGRPAGGRACPARQGRRRRR